MSRPSGKQPIELAAFNLLAAALDRSREPNPQTFKGIRRDPQHFLATVQHQQVAPLLYHLLKERDLWDLTPSVAEGSLLFDSVIQWQRSERWNRELLRLEPVFASLQETPVVLKGLGLAILDYGAADRRAFTDLDLLVQPDQFEACLDAIQMAGYRRASLMPVRTPDSKEVGEIVTPEASQRVHHAILENPPFSIDLHHCLRAHPSFDLDCDAGHRSARTFEILGREFLAPSRQDQLLCLLLGLHTDIAIGEARWKNLIDCHQVAAGLDSEELNGFLAERTKDGTLKICVNGLGLCASLLHTPTAQLLSTILEPFSRLRVQRPKDLLRLFETESLPSNRLLERKRWAMQQYDQSTVGSWLEWFRSLPLQTRAHRRSGRAAFPREK